MPKRRQPLADAELEEIKINGNTATAVFEGTFLGPQKSKSPITFEKTDGAWKINHVGTYGASETQTAGPRQNPRMLKPTEKARAKQPASIYRAASEGDLARLRELLRQGADVNAQQPNLGGTALHNAAEAGHAQIIRELLKHKADVEARDSRGFTPLMRAAERGKADAVKTLLDAGADIDAKPSVGELTAICLAVMAKDRETTQLLVDRVRGSPAIWPTPCANWPLE